MRTNLVDGLIIGLGISIFVLAARWFFGEALILWQIVVIFFGALTLVGMQLIIERYRTAQANRKVTVERTTSDTTLLHSPRMAWHTDPAPNSASSSAPTGEHGLPALVQTPVMGASPTLSDTESSPMAEQPNPLSEPILPEPPTEHSPEKMV